MFLAHHSRPNLTRAIQRFGIALMEADRAFAEGPGKLESARTTIIELRRRRNALQAEHEQNRKLIAKLEKRIGELEQRIAAETHSASEMMAAAEGEFVLPEALTKLDVELRVARATLENGWSSRYVEKIAQLLKAGKPFKYSQKLVTSLMDKNKDQHKSPSAATALSAHILRMRVL